VRKFRDNWLIIGASVLVILSSYTTQKINPTIK